MPRPRTERIHEVKARLLTRLREGLFRPGDRFLSNRAISTKFGISYQTAHRLVCELVGEGHLVRRSASGTYIPGPTAVPRSAILLFHARAQRGGSFGERLIAELTGRLDRERIAWRLAAADGESAVPGDGFPVLWEAPAVLESCIGQRRSALLLNDRPPPGIASVYIDSVSADDFSGGACAAQLLLDRAGRKGGYAILSGPAADPRSGARVQGFLSVSKAEVVPAAGWYLEDGAAVAAKALSRGPAGLFCCNDRLAQAVLDECRRRGRPAPPLVGFDDAPIAEQLNLTTIAIPWAELAAGAVAVIKRRLAGDPATSSHQIFTPRPVIRG